MPIVEEPPHPNDNGKTSVVPEGQSKTVISPTSPKEAPPSSKAANEVVLTFTFFMDKEISRVSATNQRELLARLSEDLVDALKRPTVEHSTNIILTLRKIHQDVRLLLFENIELKSKKTSLLQAVAEKESLNIDIDKAKSTLS
ncbi:Uncharacterized protein Adt_18455 [Abeliophyllum distichum]|uniref:Uncharacterized protein n=1 Tax=Abeliophyllum distichum TaxID=126358 RepID=A0ABD1TK93_9LAMI